MVQGTIARMARRTAMAMAATALLTVVTAGPALAFEPPADPAEVFTGGGPGGHPGAAGQQRAFDLGTGAAWNAHVNSDQITN